MLYRTLQPLILASGSPRRRELLAGLGLDFEVRPGTAEPLPDPGEAPDVYALRAAVAKCREQALQAPPAVVLAADSVVVAPGGAILGKPADAEDALRMLRLLCGGGRAVPHQVCTGCCLMRALGNGGAEALQTWVTCTEVVMAPQPETVLRAYVATGEPMDKAGAYAIQGMGGALVREIRGSYTNVVGLPLARVVEVLVSWGVIGPR